MTRSLIPPILCLGAFALGTTTAASAQQIAAPRSPASAPAPAPTPGPATATARLAPVASAPVRRKPARRIKPSPVLRGVAGATRAATLEPRPDSFINAVQIYPWSEGAVYQVYTAPERVTDIALQPGEMLGAVAAGDTVRWVIGDTASGSGEGKRTHVLIKPFTAGLSTNIVITTDRRSYHLALTSTVRTAMTALSWTYPADQLIALRKAAEQAQAAIPVASGLAVEQLHFGYEISGDRPAWRPLRAFDDGRQTFVEFPASLAVGEAPPLFLVDASGEVALVNYRVSGRFYVVDRLFDVAELRLGTKKQQIVRITRVAEGTQRRKGA
jgi:P-type conjugative transfer protein TrbG